MSKVRSPFTGYKESAPIRGTDNPPNAGEGFPEEVTYRGDNEGLPYSGTPSVPVPASPASTRDAVRSPFTNIPMSKRK